MPRKQFSLAERSPELGFNRRIKHRACYREWVGYYRGSPELGFLSRKRSSGAEDPGNIVPGHKEALQMLLCPKD